VRTAVGELLSDPTFDTSIEASRKRLERALAIGSEIAMRLAENGITGTDDLGMMNTLAGMYRTLANTQSKSLSEMTDEELEKEAKKR